MSPNRLFSLVSVLGVEIVALLVTSRNGKIAGETACRFVLTYDRAWWESSVCPCVCVSRTIQTNIYTLVKNSSVRE